MPAGRPTWTEASRSSPMPPCPNSRHAIARRRARSKPSSTPQKPSPRPATAATSSASGIPITCPHDVVVDPESREVINRENDVRAHADEREHPDQALLRYRAYQPARSESDNTAARRAPRQHQGLSRPCRPCRCRKASPSTFRAPCTRRWSCTIRGGSRRPSSSTPRCWRCARTISTRCRCSASSSLRAAIL